MSKVLRFGSSAYGRLLKKRYPVEQDMIRHRLWGITFGNVFIGIITMHKTTKGTQTNVKIYRAMIAAREP